ncbi:MAG: ABC transporter permease subunit [Lachnospiraceae bacterium]|nr:ABC transporter permease subunit [Lachnospiraceae bacterium]
MRQLNAFIKKEWMEQFRTNKLLIIMIVSVMMGIMAPAVAKLTPVLFEAMADTLAEQGIAGIEVGEVTALTSWQQFYKNISMLVIVFVIMYSGSYTTEYQRGTLINIVTKGMSRTKILVSKLLVQLVVWTMAYVVNFATTYVYTEYYWDNSEVKNCIFAGLMVYIFGIWTIGLLTLASSIGDTNMSVLLITGGVVAVCYILSIVPDVAEYMPTKMLGAVEVLDGSVSTANYGKAIAVLAATYIMSIVGAILIFRKKKI